KNPEWKKRVSLTLRTILKESNAVNLFCATGLPSEASFFSEAVDRLMTMALPQPPREGDLAELFSKLFSSIDDVLWLKRLDRITLTEIWSLFQEPEKNEPVKPLSVGEKIKLDMEESILLLTGQVRTYGLE